MKKIKLFPAPNLEVRVYVTDKMVEDLKECKCLAKVPDGSGKDCKTCSWRDVKIDDVGMCELLDACRQALEEENEHGQINA